MSTDSTTEAQARFRDELVAHGLLIPSSVPGVYGRSAVFEDVIERFDRYVTRMGEDDAPLKVRFPPVMPRADFEKSGYLKNMPQLAGTIHSFEGGQKEHAGLIRALEAGESYEAGQRMTDLVLTPAGCYPLYPTLRGDHGEAGKTVDVLSYCFRHEPSPDPARMQLFRMREYVRIARPQAVTTWRARWLEKGLDMMRALGLDVSIALANDPFFGRSGKMLAANQREQELKYELVVPIASEAAPTAVLSFNYHQELFGGLYGISVCGETAHTGCVGFGLERVALALLKTHGFDPQAWPLAIRELLAS